VEVSRTAKMALGDRGEEYSLALRAQAR